MVVMRFIFISCSLTSFEPCIHCSTFKVDPVEDERLAKFVVESHRKHHPSMNEAAVEEERVSLKAVYLYSLYLLIFEFIKY